MRKITYIILSLCLCTAGLGTAAHLSPSFMLSNALAAVNDTIITGDEKNIEDDEEEEEDEDVFDEEEEEYEEDEFDEEDDEEEEDDEFDEEDDEEEDEDELDEEDEEDEDDDDDEGFFTQEEQDEFGEMHDDYDDIDGDGDNDIELTEGMRVSANELMMGYNASNYLSGDTTKFVFKESDAQTYIDRLRRMPVVMDMPYNDIVRKYIDQYAQRMHRSVSIMLGAQNFYNPIFEEALEAEGCPLELKYLPVIESAYNPAATSPVGAAGLWQFMPASGKQYGLEINSLIDERRDPIKSSHAAARLLKYLYKYYGDWSLVIAAYNCGPGNVNKAIQRAGGSKDYWAIYNYLPKETRGYVPAFIAANYVMTYYCEHGITPMQAKLPAETDTIVVSRDVHLQQIAELCDVNIDQLKELNPQYRAQIVPGYWKPCAVRLPVEAVSKFIACGDSIYTHRASELLPRRSIAIVGTATTTATGTTASATPQRTTATGTRNTSYSRSNYGRTNYGRANYGRTNYGRTNYGRTNYGTTKKKTSATRTTASKPTNGTTTRSKAQTTASRGKSSSAKSRTTAAKGSTTSAKSRTTAAKGRTTSAKGRTTSAKGRTTSAKSRTTSAKSRTSSAKSRTTSAKSRTTSAKGSSSSASKSRSSSSSKSSTSSAKKKAPAKKGSSKKRK